MSDPWEDEGYESEDDWAGEESLAADLEDVPPETDVGDDADDEPGPGLDD